MTPAEKRFLSRHACGWCDQRLDLDICLSWWGVKCTNEQMAERRRECLEKRKPRGARK